MITLSRDKENIVALSVSAYEPLSEFTAVLYACGTVKSQRMSEDGKASFVFSAEEVNTVTEDLGGEYGTLLIKDADGEVRIKSMPCFRLVAEDYEKDTICISVPRQMEIAPESGGGGGGEPVDLKDYAKKTYVDAAKAEAKQYADEKAATIGEDIVENHVITIVDEQGQPHQMTVKEAMTNIVGLKDRVDSAVETVADMEETVEKLIERNVNWETKDEDGDGQPDNEMLYLTKGN